MKLARKIEKRDLLNIAFIIIVAAIYIFIAVAYTKRFNEIKGLDITSTAENIKDFILSYGGTGKIVIMLMQTLHVIISVIPGAIVQFAAGMTYGIVWAMVLGVIGNLIGTVITFYISRLLGRRVVTLFVSEKKISKIENLLSSGKSTAILWILFIVPFPKDILAYLIGLTNMRASKFFLISTIGRLPGMLVSTCLGMTLLSGNYALIIISAVLCVIVFSLLYIFKNKIIKHISKKEKKKFKKSPN